MDSTQPLLHKPAVEPTRMCLHDMPPQGEAQDTSRRAEALRSTARRFETLLLHQVIKQMNETINYTSLDEEDNAGDQIQGLAGSFMADALGQNGGVGLWKMIYEDMARTQGIDTARFPAEGSRLNEHI